MRPRLLDLFCGSGGASMGYHQAGFDVVGVDWDPQPRYPFAFVQFNVLSLEPSFLRWFDAIHASPPCQAFSKAQRLRGYDHDDLITPVRRMLKASGKPYVIENVPGAPLHDPFTLCGSMFAGLRVYRHRLFETNFAVSVPEHPEHLQPQAKMGRRVPEGHFIQVVGNFSNVAYAKTAMGIDWMTRDGLREAIPPAFTRHIGAHLLAEMQSERIAA